MTFELRMELVSPDLTAWSHFVYSMDISSNLSLDHSHLLVFLAWAYFPYVALEQTFASRTAVLESTCSSSFLLLMVHYLRSDSQS